MAGYGHVLLLVVFCADCGSKPARNPGANLTPTAAETAQPAGSAAKGTQSGAAQPQARIEARAILLPAPAGKTKELIAHQAAVTMPRARRILYPAASPATGEIFVLAAMCQDSYGGTPFVVRPNAAEQRVEEVMVGTNLTAPDAPASPQTQEQE
jgi:hypothetical protein